MQFAQHGAAVAHARVAGHGAEHGVGFERLHDVVERVVVKHGVAVDADDVAAVGVLEAVVHGGGLAGIALRQGHDFVLACRPFFDDFQRGIAAAVVDKHQFVIRIIEPEQVRNRVFEIVFLVETGNQHAHHRHPRAIGIIKVGRFGTVFEKHEIQNARNGPISSHHPGIEHHKHAQIFIPA